MFRDSDMNPIREKFKEEMAKPDYVGGHVQAVSDQKALKELIKELTNALEATLEWIDAVPADVRVKLPPMPGFDYDWVQDTIGDGKAAIGKPQDS